MSPSSFPFIETKNDQGLFPLTAHFYLLVGVPCFWHVLLLQLPLPTGHTPSPRNSTRQSGTCFKHIHSRLLNHTRRQKVNNTAVGVAAAYAKNIFGDDLTCLSTLGNGPLKDAIYTLLNRTAKLRWRPPPFEFVAITALCFKINQRSTSSG